MRWILSWPRNMFVLFRDFEIMRYSTGKSIYRSVVVLGGKKLLATSSSALFLLQFLSSGTRHWGQWTMEGFSLQFSQRM